MLFSFPFMTGLINFLYAKLQTYFGTQREDLGLITLSLSSSTNHVGSNLSTIRKKSSQYKSLGLTVYSLVYPACRQHAVHILLYKSQFIAKRFIFLAFEQCGWAFSMGSSFASFRVLLFSFIFGGWFCTSNALLQP